MQKDNKTSSPINTSYEDDIPVEYRKKQPDREMTFTLGEFAEEVTPETLKYFLMRMANETKHGQGGDYRDLIIKFAAIALNMTINDLWLELEKYEGPVGKFHVVNASDWLNSEPPPPDQIIEDLVDRGDKIGIIGGSKQRKSYFFVQMVMCFATGRDFLGFLVPKKRRVLMVQFEIQKDHYQRRIKRIAKALGISAKEIVGNLMIINARGIGVTAEDVKDEICRIALRRDIEIVAFDPLYKLMYEGENDTSAFRPILAAFDYLAEKSGVATAYVHHDPKGEAGDRNLEDRGSGSNILGRDYDACFALSPHGSGDKDVSVVEILLRNYPPREGISIEWNGQCFVPRPDLPPSKRTSKNKKNSNNLPLNSYEPCAIRLVKDKPMKISIFKDQLKKECVLTVERMNTVIDSLTSSGKLVKHTEKGRGKNDCWIGLPEAIEEMKRK